jgi:hypothetical protein
MHHEFNLAPFPHKFVTMFLDGILVCRPLGHMENLKLVQSKLRNSQLFSKLNNWGFGQFSVLYLGHIISYYGLSTDPEKTIAI